MSDMSSLHTSSAPSARKFGFINWMGLWTLYKKECLRFLRIAPQTLLAPIISNLLYMTVFVLAFAALRDDPDAFIAFLAPGLIMLGVLNNASANSSSSVMQGKIMGNLTDLLVTPLSFYELAIGWITGAATRGILVAISTGIALAFFAPLMPTHVWAVIFFSVSAALMMSMVGVLSGMWAEKFDQLAVVNQFIILPLSFLSGTFYRIDVLPETFQTLILGNPLFYVIDGFRYGFLGEADSNIAIGVAFISAINIVLFITVLLVLRAGWRIKS